MITRKAKLQTFVNKYFSDRLNHEEIKVLEARCGARSPIKFEVEHYIVGIDISSKQIERNKVIKEGIIGDIQTYPLKHSEYDVIICQDVLEHLPNPDLVLENFKNAIKPKGLIVIGIPNVLSLKGLITKYTPTIFHVIAYKYIYRNPYHTGEEDKGTF